MNEARSERRPDIWSGPEGAAIRNEFVKNGYGETIRTVDALREIDTHTLIKTAKALYGTSEDISQKYADILAEIDSGYSTGKVPRELMGIDEDLVNDFKLVTYNWHGPAYTSALNYNNGLRSVTRLEKVRSGMLGDQVLEFASAVEKASEKSETTVLGAANLLWAQVGLGASVVSGGAGGIVISAVGMIGAITAEVKGEIERYKTEIESTTEAKVNITERDAEHLGNASPEDLMPDFPDDVDAWKVGE